MSGNRMSGRPSLKGASALRVFAFLSVATLAIVACAVLLYEYKKPSFPVAPLNTLNYPDFQTFPTPRTFDPPGTVFRIDPSGTRFPVATLPVTPDSGREALASYTTTSKWTLSGLLKFIKKSDVEGTTEGSFTVTVKVVLGGGFRERTYDSEIEQLLRSAIINFRSDNKYYIIRETISVSDISYEISGLGELKGGAKESIGDITNGDQNLSWADNSNSTLIEKFDRPYRIFFTADELLPHGLGASESGPKHIPVKETISWVSESDR